MMQQLVAEGVRDGSIAAINPFLTGIGVLGIVEWISYWYTNRLPYTRRQITDELTDIIVNGVTKSRPFDVNIARLDTPYPPMEQADPFDKKAVADMKLQRFLRTAMESFNKNGVQATSIDRIAGQLNVTKGAFYYYFKNKEELLYLCYERATAFNRVAATHVQTRDFNEREILTRRSLFERHVSDLGPFPAYHNLSSLEGHHHTNMMEDMTEIQNEDRDRIARATTAEDFREVDPFVAEKVRAGLINWFPVWYSPAGRYTPTEVADNHSWLFLNGLASTD
jgi:AcrR family transcriptional regulator